MTPLESYFLEQTNRPEKCAKCGTMLEFKGLGEFVCPKCGESYYDDYGKVRNYLDENPRATVLDTSMATGVSERSIKAMLRAERLEVTEDSRVSLKCRGCGTPIQSGTYCPVCARLANAVENRKKREEMMEEKKKNLQGLIKAQEGADGKLRFRHDS